MPVSLLMIITFCMLVSAAYWAWTDNRVFTFSWLHGSKFDLVIWLFANTLSSLVQITIPSSHLQVTMSAVILNSFVLLSFTLKKSFNFLCWIGVSCHTSLCVPCPLPLLSRLSFFKPFSWYTSKTMSIRFSFWQKEITLLTSCTWQ